MSFDYKKEYKEFYLPAAKPSIVTVPAMNFVAVRGAGNPNMEDGEYSRAVSVLYAVSFTIKMNGKKDPQMQGYFEYVVPPLEGFWWMDGVDGIDYSVKDDFKWISLIRLPDFVTYDDFCRAVEQAERKKKVDLSAAEFLTYDEGLCVQCLHVGAFDNEPETVLAMTDFTHENGYITDITSTRYHHEIYLSDARRVAPERQRTVIRHPIKKA